MNKKRILVVGGSSGIGRGIANCFLNLNADVCITGTKKNIEDYGLEDVVSQKSEYVQLDLLDPEALGNLVIPFDSLTYWSVLKELFNTSARNLKWKFLEKF